MGTRGKKSAASLTVINSPGMKRAPAPTGLPAEGVDLWQNITASYPADHFAAQHLPLLESYVRAVLNTRAADKMIDSEGLFTSESKAHPAFAIRDQAIKQQCQLSTKLRLAISSAVRADSARNRPGATGAKPWESSGQKGGL